MISEKNLRKLKSMLERHEGKKHKPYRCSNGFLTVGCGRNLDTVGLRDSEIYLMLHNDIEAVTDFLRLNYDWFENLNDARQAALIDFAFCVGPGTFKKFRRMRAALSQERWTTASYELLDSRFASQVGNRAKDLAHMIRTGRWMF